MHAPDKVTEIRAALALLLATLTALWGWLGWAIIIWATCIVLDYASGTAAAKKNGEWSSAVAREGLWHKLGEIFAVLVAALCDLALHVLIDGAGIALPIETGAIITPVVILWYIITELGSIVENAGALGAPVPKWLQSSLKDYKDKLDRSQDAAGYTGKHETASASVSADKPPDETTMSAEAIVEEWKQLDDDLDDDPTATDEEEDLLVYKIHN